MSCGSTFYPSFRHRPNPQATSPSPCGTISPRFTFYCLIQILPPSFLPINRTLKSLTSDIHHGHHSPSRAPHPPLHTSPHHPPHPPSRYGPHIHRSPGRRRVTRRWSRRNRRPRLLPQTTADHDPRPQSLLPSISKRPPLRRRLSPAKSRRRRAEDESRLHARATRRAGRRGHRRGSEIVC